MHDEKSMGQGTEGFRVRSIERTAGNCIGAVLLLTIVDLEYLLVLNSATPEDPPEEEDYRSD